MSLIKNVGLCMNSIYVTLGSAWFFSPPFISTKVCFSPYVAISLDLQRNNNKVYEVIIWVCSVVAHPLGCILKKHEGLFHSTKIESGLCHKAGTI